MNQLSGLDAAFLHVEAALSAMHLGAIAIYDPTTAPEGRFDFEHYRQNVEARLHRAHCFRRKVVDVPLGAGHPYWEDDADFDLDAHIRHVALPSPGDWHELCIAAARFQERPLDPDRPLWEMEVIEGLVALPGLRAGAFAVATKVHHSAVDGVAGADLLAALHDLSPDAEAERPDAAWTPEPPSTALARLSRAAPAFARRPLELSRVLAHAAPAAARGLWEITGGDLPALAPHTRFNGPVSRRRVFEARSFDLQRLREIKKSVPGATVNDVVLSVCGGALRKYLGRHGELPEATLRAIAPISVRSADEQACGGNRFSYMTVSVRSDLAGPLARLRAVRRDTHRAKQRSHAVGGGFLADAIDLVPGSLLRGSLSALKRLGAVERLNRFCNTIITNVPGPPVPLYSAGSRLQAIYGLGPILDGMGLIHPVFSYCGKITIAVSCCSRMMPDAGFYAACLEASFRDLERAVWGPSTEALLAAHANGEASATA